MMNNKVSFTNSNNPTISLSAVIYFPPKFDETRQYPAIVVSHPGGGVKEQTAGTYAEKLAEKGFVTIAYDASYQGESGGEPRQLENPYIRTEDVSAVIDYLTTLSYVDNTRIGAMGICAGAGYTANAAIQDRRIKAIGTVSAVNIGSMFRNGWENNVKSIDALPYVDAGSNARTSDISSGEYAVMPLAPMKESDAPNEELRQAWEYYHTPRAQYPTAPGYATLRSLNQIITYDAYHMAEVYLTQPIYATLRSLNQIITYDAYHMAEVYLTQPMQIVAGSQAGSKWMSDDLYDRASSQDKRYHIVEGANHMDLYDGKVYMAEAISVLAPFFEETL